MSKFFGFARSFLYAALLCFTLPTVAQSVDAFSAAAKNGNGSTSTGRSGTSALIQSGASVQLPSVTNPSTLTKDRFAPAAAGHYREEALLKQQEAERPRPKFPPEPNEFQQFLYSSTGKQLDLFGQEFFSNPPSTFAPVADAPVAPDYMVGPGDEVVVRAWGQIEFNLSLTVDRNGMLVIPKVGAVFVGGMRYQDMQGAIHAEMSKVYRNFEMAVTMGQLRGIQIFVVGMATQPGSYTVGSMSTLVNALFAAGGPSPKGSMRRIQLKRANKVISEFDLYDMLLKGDTSKDIRLRQGDVIVIPPSGPMVAVAGSITTSAVFELKQDTTSLGEVLGWAGGLTTVTRGQNATLERIDARESRKVEEFKLDGEGLKQTLRDGDLVTLFAISPKFDNAVTVRGFVAQPSRYPWREGLRVRDLLPTVDAVTSPEYWRSRNRTLTEATRANRDPMNRDSINRDSINRDSINRDSINRDSINRDSINRDSMNRDLTNRDRYQDSSEGLRLVSPQEVSWDYAVIERLKPNATTELVAFNLGAAVIKGDPQHNMLLQPGDIVTVFSSTDVRIPQGSQRRYVRLEGEFVGAGVYSARPGETLRQLVARMGGFTSSAYLFGAEFIRESARVLQQKQLDESLNRMEQEAERTASNASRNALNTEDAVNSKARAEAQRQLIAKLRSIKATGRLVLDLPPDQSASVKDLPDLPLEDGDRFFVPPTPSVVSVLGSVFNPNTFIYRDTKRANDYLAQAGGPSRSADEDSLYLLRADGSVVSKRQKGWFGGMGGERVMPGDAIIVPEDFERVSLSKELKDWSQIFYQFALGVAGLKVLQQ
jgi:polysaccharide export outer membrane protein